MAWKEPIGTSNCCRSQACHPSFVKVWILVEHPRSDDKIERRVAQELEPLVVTDLFLGMFVDVGWVGDGTPEVNLIAEAMS